MVYITQLIYLKTGAEAIFDAFEAVAIPIIAKYQGVLLFRLRPSQASDFLEAQMDLPYEIHLVSFPTEAEFEAFLADEERRQFLHLKEQSIRASFLYKGTQL